MKKYSVSFLIVFSFALAGCSPERYVGTIKLELDGKLSFILYDEYALKYEDPLISVSDFNQEIEYKKLIDLDFEEGEENLESIYEIHKGIIAENNGVVDSRIYQYIVKIPVKSDKSMRLMQLEAGFSYGSWSSFTFQRCDNKNIYRGLSGYFHTEEVEELKSDSKYHFNLYIKSNLLASLHNLNNVGDICTDYFHSTGGGTYEDSAVIKSNNILIPAQDFKDELNRLGIWHE